MVDNTPLVSFYIPSFERGGVERLIINLSRELVKQGVDVDVLVRETDPPIEQLDAAVTVVEFDSLKNMSNIVHGMLPPHVSNAVLSLPTYVWYLRCRNPNLLISMQTSPFAVLGAALAGMDTNVVVRESNTPSVATSTPTHRIGRFATTAKRLTYPMADHVIAVSEDAADDIAEHVGIARDKIKVIYNPTYNETIIERAQEPVGHPWFNEDIPIVLSVGRFSDQKDFETLIRAFARVLDQQPTRLVLVGDGKNRKRLEMLASDLGIEEDVIFLGYQQNPYKFMARSDLFVLSSKYEGLPNVLIEAIGVGLPAIATDCPSGPREILLDGNGGYLVAVGEVAPMANAIQECLNNRDQCMNRLDNAREALDRFTPERAASRYLELIE